MNTAPLQSWDGAEAIFTFADKPAVVMLLLLGALAVTVGTIVVAAVHEKHAYSNHK
ncbi:hypothetical protein [Marinibacterium profundimaris]|uniref:hypothetical protein n=1 Tax=Marinibacterium profundimaris TaxID=1679460 RepID=UPI0018E96200|nr:hypothetical protein [Marinibacterium profundimaris]